MSNIKDLISRQVAINALSDGALVNYQAAGDNNGLVKAIDVIKGIPSAQQKPLKYTGNSICLYCQTVDCDGCVYEPMEGEQNV